MVAWLETAQWLVLLGMAVMGAGILYLLADINRRLGPDLGAVVPNDGLAIGSVAPAFEAPDLRTAQPVRLASHAGRPAVVAFLSPLCGACLDLVPHLNRLAEDRREVPIIVVALSGDGVDYRPVLSPGIALVGDDGGALQRGFDVRRTPLVFLVDVDGKVRMRTVSSNLVNLEDTLAAIGRPQGSARWVPDGAGGMPVSSNGGATTAEVGEATKEVV